MIEKLYKIPKKECEEELNGTYDDRRGGCIVRDKHSIFKKIKTYGRYGVRGYFDDYRPSNIIKDISAFSSPLGAVATGADSAYKIIDRALICGGIVEDTAKDIRENDLNSKDLFEQEKNFIDSGCGSSRDFWKDLKNELVK